MSRPVYALNLFNVSSRDEYLEYARRSPRAVAAHDGTSDYIWQLFDRLEDLRPILKG